VGTVLLPSKISYGVDAFILLDGYHRAVGFWKRGEPTDKLAVYVPC
jgi:hypothetical protein